MGIEQRLKDELRRVAGAAQPPSGAWDGIEGGLRSQTRRSVARRATTVVLALTVSALTMNLVFVAFRGSHGEPEVRGPGSSSSRVFQVLSTLKVGEYPRAVAVGGGAIWVAIPETDNSLSDPCSGAIYRIDALTNRVADVVPVQGIPVDVASTPDEVWVLVRSSCADSSSEVVVGVDPLTGMVTERIPLEDSSGVASHLAADASSLWVTRRAADGSGTLLQVDAASAQQVAVVSLSGDPREVQVGPTHVWVYVHATDGGSVVAIDPLSMRIEHVELPSPVDATPNFAMAVGLGSLWVPLNGEQVARVSESDLIAETFSLPGGFHPFAVDESGVWFWGSDVAAESRVVAHLSASSQEVDDAVIPIMDAPVDAAAETTDGAIWILGYPNLLIQIGPG